MESHRRRSSLSQEAGEEYTASEFGGIRDYKRRKRVKLQNQDAAYRAQQTTPSPMIFKGYTIAALGYTNPNSNVLRSMVVKHGGVWKEFKEHGLTIVVATAIPPKKREEYRRLRIVEPKWIIDCVEAGKILEWSRYRIGGEGEAQATLGFDASVQKPKLAVNSYKDIASDQVVKEALKFARLREFDSQLPSDCEIPESDEEGDMALDDYSSLDLLSDLDLPEGYSTPTSSPPDKMPKAPSLKRSASITAPFTTIKKPKLPDPDVNLREESPRPRIASPSTVAPRLTKENAQTPEEFNEIFLSDPKVYAASVLNPDFLPKFFKESRLHHLSTWKAELRSRMQERAQKASQISPPKARATRYIMHVDFDCFFAAVSTRDLPDLKNKPVAICHGRTENSATSEIASCNYAARKFGVKNGMWMASAKRLCPDIVALGYDFDKYEEASEAFYSVVLALGGERLQAVSVDEVLVDISNLVCNDYYSDQGQEEAAAMKLATTVRNECRKRTGCEVSVGIGMNVVMARLALRKAKPAGQLMIPRSEIRSVLDELNVSAFPGIGKHTSNRIIEKFGTDSVLEVRKIPRERLRQTLGVKTGERVYELCNGIDHTQVGAAKTLRESISISVNWGVRFTEMGQAEEFLHRLSQAVVEKMKGEKVKGRVLNFKVAKRAQGVPYETEKFLGCGKVEEMNKTFSFGAPTNDAILIVRKCVELLKGFRVSPGDIRGFGIGMKGLEDEDDGQQQLKF
ncbi:DNA polymerase IV, partial [Sphaerosporella brunnea]